MKWLHLRVPLLTKIKHVAIPCRTYRGLYILNWVWRFWHEPNYRQWIGGSPDLCSHCIDSAESKMVSLLGEEFIIVENPNLLPIRKLMT